MAYTYEKPTYELIADGDYEVIITDISVRTFESGAEKLEVTFRIRDDVEQGFKNRTLRDDIWREKEHPEYYDRRKINRLLATQYVKEGTEFETIKDVIDILNGAYLIVKVGKRFSEYRDSDENFVKGFKTTQNQLQGINTDNLVEISEDDLPF